MIFLFALLVSMLILGRGYMNTSSKTKIRNYNSRINPTIMLPGSEATRERFNGTIDSLNKMGKKHSVLKLTVHKNDNITYSGQIAANDVNPYIVIGFEDNSDSYANIKRQAKWLDHALAELQKKYHFRDFNAIGHSNGGLDWTVYLEQYYSDEDFNMQTLMTIGTPYNFEVVNSSNRTQMLQDLIKEQDNLPDDLTVYNVAGTNNYDGDYIVPVTSVETGKYIFQKTVDQYTQVTVTGSEAEHSDLPENKEVLDLISENILHNKSKKLKPQN
ncbi:alpha/beta hydrolase [Streptococcus macacae]